MEEKQKLNKPFFIKKLVAGFAMGIAGIVPGVNGSVMAISFGVYKGMIDAIAGLFKNAKQSLLYLLPIAIGMIAGFLSMSNAMEWMMAHWRTHVLFLFIGLVLGGMPTIVKEGNKPNGFKPKYLIATAIGFTVMLILLLFTRTIGEHTEEIVSLSPLQALLSGAILSLVVIPGLGVTFILIGMGYFAPLMSAVNHFDILTLLLVGAGCVAALLLIVKGVQKVFERYTATAYYAVLGLSVASAVAIFPSVTLDISLLWDILLLIGGFIASYAMTGNIHKKTSAPLLNANE